MQVATGPGNPFGVLTSIVAPAILTNACSLLVLGTSNRLARVVDRTRAVGALVGSLPPEGAERQAWESQLSPLKVRSYLLLRSLRLFYSSIGLFAFAALLSVGGSIASYYGQRLVFEAIAVFAALSGASAVIALAYGSALVIRETRIAVQNLSAEAAILMRHPRSPSSSSTPAPF